MAHYIQWGGGKQNVRLLSLHIRVSLQEEYQLYSAEAGTKVKYLFASDPNLVKEVWGWYKDAVNPPPSPPRARAIQIDHQEHDNREGGYLFPHPSARPDHPIGSDPFYH